jgi:hypothetical protein
MDGLLLQLPAFDPASRWWLIILAVLTIVYAVMRPSRRKKDPLNQSNPGLTLASQRQVERDMNNLLVELSEMARQITGQLDTRAAKLQLLIAEADQKLAQLGAAGAPTAIPERPPSHRHADVPAPPPVDPRHIEVYVLADQGRTASEVAQRLSRPTGEIELILALRERAAHI